MENKSCKLFLRNNQRLNDFMTNAIREIGGKDKYVAFIKNITDEGMNGAWIENRSDFQRIQPIEAILKNNQVTNENNNADENIDHINENDNQELKNIDNNDSNLMEMELPSNYEPLSDENNNKTERINDLVQYKTKPIFASSSDYDQLIYSLLFWNGQGGCGKLSDEVKFQLFDILLS